MPDHSVRQKLVKQVLPYLVAVSNLKKQWFYLFTRFFVIQPTLSAPLTKHYCSDIGYRK